MCSLATAHSACLRSPRFAGMTNSKLMERNIRHTMMTLGVGDDLAARVLYRGRRIRRPPGEALDGSEDVLIDIDL